MKIRAAALAAALAAAAPAGATAPPPLPAVEGVPVLGQAWLGNVADSRLAVLTIHGVRRIPGASVVYYSMGLRAADRTGSTAFFGAYGNGNNYVLNQNGVTSLPCVAAAIDLANGKAYSALRVKTGQHCISTSVVDFDAPKDALGKAPVGYTVLAPIPAGVDTVDVLVGSALVQSVPVQDGPLEPVVDDPAPAVGTGWPRIETGPIAEAYQPEKAVFPLRTQIQDVAEEVATTTKDGQDELQLDAAVLFATDKATLTPRAGRIIDRAAKRITAAGTAGTIIVTGHTDNTASDAYNLDLSRRRAAAVAAALRTRLPSGVTIRTVGKGETEPIADNSTAQGRALNRRVTITLPTGAPR